MTNIIIKACLKVDICVTKHTLMKKNFTRETLPANYEICGIGAAPEEDSLVVMSSEAIHKLRKNKPGFFANLFSGPYELCGTGASAEESGIVDQELIERGIRF